LRTIVLYIKEYLGNEWNPRLFLSVGVLLALSFAVNYGFISETSVIRQISNPMLQFVFYFFYYGIPYAATIALYSATTGKKEFLSDTGFIFLTVFSFVLLSTYITLHNLPSYLLRTSPGIYQSISPQFYWYANRYASNLLPGFAILIPLAWYWRTHDKHSSRFYGFSSSSINLKTYFAIIALLVPIVAIASFAGDFQSAYPRYKFGLPQHLTATEASGLIGGFEFCYGVDFVFVELLFRGFFVLAFARYLGSASILPMVVAYAFIHFQKPMGEAIGSIAGGFVLGIIAYRTTSIYGGVILHLGVAYIMEIAGTIHLLLTRIR
jgi:hypothetical protein